MARLAAGASAAAASSMAYVNMAAAPGSGAASRTAAVAAPIPIYRGDQEDLTANFLGNSPANGSAAVPAVPDGRRGDHEISAAPSNSPGSVNPGAVARPSRVVGRANARVRRRLRSRRSWRDLPPPNPLS